MMPALGGAIVRRRFKLGDREVVAGMQITQAEIEALPPRNRNALINGGFLETYPSEDGDGVPVRSDGELFLVNQGSGRYDVVRGSKLNGKPMTKEEAEALLTKTRDRDKISK